MSTYLITPPSVEPVIEAQALIHLGIDPFDSDISDGMLDYIDGLIPSVRKDCEAFTNRVFLTQTWNLYLDAWPSKNYIEIPKPPLQSVTHVKYTDIDGTQTTFDDACYSVDTKSVKGRIVLEYGQTWPSAVLHPSNPIEIQFIAGYGDTADDVPKAIQFAILLQMGDLYDNREDERDGKLIRPSQRLLWPYCVIT